VSPLQKWPANTRHEACVSDIVNHTFNLRKFLEHEELERNFLFFVFCRRADNIYNIIATYHNDE
jgi:hypothetical protein